MKKLIPSAAAIAIRDDKILLVREGEQSGHMTGMCGLPGGRVNNDETEQTAAAREFHEETGLYAKTTDFREFENNYYKAEISRKDGSTMNFGWRVFKVLNFFGELKRSDAMAAEWFSLEEIERFESEGKLLPNVLSAIHAALKT